MYCLFVDYDVWGLCNQRHHAWCSWQCWLGFSKGLGSNLQVFQVENREYGGADETQKSKNLDLPNKILNDVQTSQQMFSCPLFVRN